MSTSLFADTFAPGDANIRYMGRIDKTDPAHYVLAFAGSEIETKFNGTSIGLKFSAGTASSSTGANCPDYYNVFIDGSAVAMATVSGANQTVNYTGLTDTLHKLRIVKRDHNVYQWCAAATSFDGLVTGAGKALAAPDPYQTGRKMLFIGDSWTVGYGDMGETLGCVTNPHLVATNNYIAYGPLLARDFCAQYHVIAETGHGLVNNNGTGPTSFPMPQIFNMLNPKVSSRVWDHTSFVPDVVVVFLGINDCYGGGTTQAALESGWNSFLTTIRGKYPNAEIFMAATASGSSCNPGTAVTNVYNARVGSDPKLSKVIFGPVNQAGCNGHPNPAGEQTLHDALFSLIQTRMGWYSCNVVPTSTPTICGACSPTFTASPTPTPLPCTSLQVDDVEDGNLNTQAGGTWAGWTNTGCGACTSTLGLSVATIAGGTGKSVQATGTNNGDWMSVTAGFSMTDINGKATVDFDFYSSSATVQWYVLIESTEAANTAYSRLGYSIGATTVGWKHFSIPLSSFAPNGPFGSVTTAQYLAGATGIIFSADATTKGAYTVAMDNVKVLCPAVASPTRTPTPNSFTATFTSTRTATPSASPSPSSTFTQTVSPSASPSSSNTPSRTATGSPTSTRTVTGTPTSSVTSSSSPTALGTLSSTPTPTASSTRSNTPTFSSTVTVNSPTSSQTPTVTPTFTPTFTRSTTGTFTSTVTVNSPTSSRTPSNTPVNTSTSTVTPSSTSVITSTSTSTGTFTRTSTVTPTLTSTATPTGSVTPSSTRTISPTFSVTETFTDSPTVTPFAGSPTDTSTVSPTFSSSATPSVTPVDTSTSTSTGTPTSTVSGTPTLTVSPTLTASPTPLFSSTSTSTMSPSPTFSETVIGSFTNTATYTVTPNSTSTPSVTASRTASPSSTPTPLNTSTASSTAIAVATSTPTFTVTVVTVSSSTFTATPANPGNGGSGPFAILRAAGNPNPVLGQSMGISLLLNRPAASVEWKIFSAALNVAAAGTWVTFNQAGWHQRSMDVSALPNGTWFVQLVGVSDTGARTKDVVIKVMVMR